MQEVVRTSRKTGKKEKVLQPPKWIAHADFVHPFEFIRFAMETKDLKFDIMLEAKAKDLALLRLRQDILCYAPELQDRFDAAGASGLTSQVEIPAQEFETS
jgi:UV DNA damage endonuclease